MLRTIFKPTLLGRVAPHHKPTCQSVASKLLNISPPACTGALRSFHTSVSHHNKSVLAYESWMHDKHHTDEMCGNEQLSPACVDTSENVRFKASPDVGVEALPSEQEEACVALVASPEWCRFLLDFDVNPHLMKPGYINVFEQMDRYYKESNLVRAADVLAYTIAAKSRGWSYVEILADEEKEAQCAIIAENIEPLCYAGLELGILRLGLSPYFYLMRVLRSMESVIPENVVFAGLKGVDSYKKAVESFVIQYGLKLVQSDVLHYKYKEWLVRDAKIILRQNLMISVSNLKRNHADIRHACMEAAHGATLATGDGAIVDVCNGSLEKLGV
ncbi:hypothetical protein K440DRAFT_641541 [Wilcoxina mikolae CBS 423.85]|nr:hypothetical protein K440DRAFT_641541 [Wilcoxina mikolae CBS 423.85]